MRDSSAVLLCLVCFTVAACSDGDSTSPRVSSYAEFQRVLSDNCGACHSHLGAHINLTNAFQAGMDSAALVESGFINPRDPAQSVIFLKAQDLTPHGGGRIASLSATAMSRMSTWIARQPIHYAYQLTAARIDPTVAPVVDGDATDAAWATATEIVFPISGGWADGSDVTMAALYDAQYVYFLLSWADDRASETRQPWVKQADGTWRTAPAKPMPYDGWTWSRVNAESPQFMYEDKAALMWNTYGESTVAGFDRAGCAVTCHDPAQGFGPGKTYFYSDQNRAAKKYTNTQGEIADMWHWKLVRMNQHNRLDDQYVRYWQPQTGDPASGGRASDAGSGGYGSNPATNGRPTYRGPTSLTAPPFFILDSEKVPVTEAELAALPAGAMIANMITSGPTLTRADVEARGRHDAMAGRWTLEIRRSLVTGDTKDVQFDDMTREYVFGVAVFDNAQIEHSYSSTPLRLLFQR